MLYVQLYISKSKAKCSSMDRQLMCNFFTKLHSVCIRDMNILLDDKALTYVSIIQYKISC